jgi:hypothetical protein
MSSSVTCSKGANRSNGEMAGRDLFNIAILFWGVRPSISALLQGADMNMGFK